MQVIYLMFAATTNMETWETKDVDQSLWRRELREPLQDFFPVAVQDSSEEQSYNQNQPFRA